MVTFRVNIYKPLDGGMVILQFAARSFHTNKLCSGLYSIKSEFYFLKTKYCFLSHLLGDLGVTYAFLL